MVLILFISATAGARQGISITGHVTDENNQPMVGVTVKVKASSEGVSTNASGVYAIQVTDSKAVLVFSYLGYTTREVAADGRTTLDVQLTPDKAALTEVVIVGYGSQRKAATTGAISTIKAAELTQTPVANLAQGLQGRVAGLEVIQNSAAPGGNSSVRIRGINSINGTSEPLYIIDGVQAASGEGTVLTMSPLSEINPNDIESVEVLKDASSTAIYGARGSNGVILITTRHGKAGKSVISYDGYAGTQRNSKTLDVMNAAEFAVLENEVYKTTLYPDPASLGEGTDWQKLIFRNAGIQSHQLSVAGGNEKTQLALSANYFDQDGVILNTGFKRYSFRVNVDHNATKILKVGASIYSSVSGYDGVDTAPTNTDAGNQGVLNAALTAAPMLVPYRDNGSLFPYTEQFSGRYKEARSPLALLAQMRKTTSNNTTGNAYAQFNLAKGLTYKASFNAVIGNGLYDYYSPANLGQTDLTVAGGAAEKNNSRSQTLLHESIVAYNRTFGEDHNIDATAVYGTQSNTTSGSFITASNFPNDATKNDALQLAAIHSVSSVKARSRLDSYAGRLNYGYKNKLFLNLTGRFDGSSKFGANHKWGFFPAVGLAYRPIEEKFMENVSFISDLKIRGSWGITGNAGAINPYGSLALVSSAGNYYFDHTNKTGISPAGIPNADLRWEQAKQVDVGLDMGFFRDRLSVVVDVYRKNTDGLLFTKSLPVSSGNASITGNYAGLLNRGVEAFVRGNIANGPLKFDMSVNLSVNRNKVTGLDGFTQELSASNYSVIRVGEPLGMFKTYVYNGIYQTGETILPGSGSRIGGVKVKDLNNDGKIDASDQTLTGNPNAKYTLGFSPRLQYKNIDLNLFVQSSQGRDVFNVTRFSLENPLGGRNVMQGLVNRWSATNPGNEFVSGNQGGRNPITDRYVENGSFTRFKNLSVGYTVQKLKYLSRVRAYLSANNLFTSTKYSGYDPEVNVNGSSNTLLGVDNGVYPVAKSYLLGLQITL
ncbi:SusC/RagA family TonB-linked outer membrane protein [Pedobacter sp. HMF7056]|uniref:SusC/RagA family TonB-linked outer membrane protein n=2 Tax=Hufsiella ginkgonis TaxID=2695274 RepID=A0A7K1XUQ3_9SPHI|nr:SusC/RagA family TonB-linked outer membrane protein [Hufsiella ginkgonis]